MPKMELAAFTALYPVPVVLVSCVDRKLGRVNAATIAWCGTVASNPPLVSVSIRPSRYSHALITKEREFVINIPGTNILNEVDLCGTLSGKEIDKFKRCKFTAVPTSKIAGQMIKECPVNIECRLKDVLKFGSHDMFIAEVVSVHADNDIVGQDKNIDYDRARPFVFNHGEYWDLNKKIGNYGCSSRNKDF